MEKICVECGKSHSRRGDYCSRKCYDKVYYSKNKEKALKRMKKYQQDNIKQLQDYRKQYYQQYYQKKEKIEKVCIVCGKLHTRRSNYCSQSCLQKNIYLKNKKQIKERVKQYYQDNKERIKEYKKQYYQKNKELKSKLDKLEQDYFYLNMVDHWDSSDFRYAEKLRSQMVEIRNKLKELKGE